MTTGSTRTHTRQAQSGARERACMNLWGLGPRIDGQSWVIYIKLVKCLCFVFCHQDSPERRSREWIAWMHTRPPAGGPVQKRRRPFRPSNSCEKVHQGRCLTCLGPSSLRGGPRVNAH